MAQLYPILSDIAIKGKRKTRTFTSDYALTLQTERAVTSCISFSLSRRTQISTDTHTIDVYLRLNERSEQ